MGSRKLEIMVIGVMVLAFIAFVISAAMILLPFNPLTFNSVSVQQEACAQEAIESEVDYSLDENEFDLIQSMDVQSSWIAEDVPGVEEGAERIISEIILVQDQLEPGRTLRPSRIPRIAPNDPGVWRLKLRNIVRSGPRIQEVEVMADNSTTVLGSENPECGPVTTS